MLRGRYVDYELCYKIKNCIYTTEEVTYVEFY